MRIKFREDEAAEYCRMPGIQFRCKTSKLFGIPDPQKNQGDIINGNLIRFGSCMNRLKMRKHILFGRKHLFFLNGIFKTHYHRSERPKGFCQNLLQNIFGTRHIERTAEAILQQTFIRKLVEVYGFFKELKIGIEGIVFQEKVGWC